MKIKHIASPVNLLLLMVYLIAIYIMEGSILFSSEFYATAPYIIALGIWGYIHSSQQEEGERNPFNVDFYIISHTIILCYFCSLFFEGNNSDIRGWWVVGLAIMGFGGIAYALIYSSISLLQPKEHKLYTRIFSVCIIGIFILTKFLYRGAFWQFIFASLVFHLIFCLLKMGFNIYKMNSKEIT